MACFSGRGLTHSNYQIDYLSAFWGVANFIPVALVFRIVDLFTRLGEPTVADREAWVSAQYPLTWPASLSAKDAGQWKKSKEEKKKSGRRGTLVI